MLSASISAPPDPMQSGGAHFVPCELRPILKIKDLSKSYGHIDVLKKACMSLYPGEIIGLLGANGAGKTTLIECIMGAIVNYHGSVMISGLCTKENPSVIAKHAAFMLEPAFCNYMSARDNLMLIASIIDVPPEKVNEVLRVVSLSDAARRKPSTFSFGMLQRLGLAQTLLVEPDVLVLDEPFVGLDPRGISLIKTILQKLAANNTGIIFSSHQVEDVEGICHEVVLLENGVIGKRIRVEDATHIKKIKLHFERPINTKFAKKLDELIPNVCLSKALDIACMFSIDDFNQFIQIIPPDLNLIDIEITRHNLAELLVDGARR
jgi:ABC-2 type transport system ATP-binding protein